MQFELLSRSKRQNHFAPSLKRRILLSYYNNNVSKMDFVFLHTLLVKSLFFRYKKTVKNGENGIIALSNLN